MLGCPVHQKPEVLTEFLLSLKELKQNSYKLTFYFIDDNRDEQSSLLLKEFNKEVDHCLVENSKRHDEYQQTERHHIWNDHLVWKVAGFKNKMIEYALEQNFDYLFLIDSDLIIHPNTVEQLIEQNKPIISTIFWTKWEPELEPLPQVWLKDTYTLYDEKKGENLSENEKIERQQLFIDQLKQPGLYEVGGLGACTLISKEALSKGVNFNEIRNVSFWGEDRHFCIRAHALGLPLYVDTHFPAYHIYRVGDLDGVKAYKELHLQSTHDNKESKKVSFPYMNSKHHRPLTLSMIVKNEADRYLKQVLNHHRQYIDQAVIIDDGSNDGTEDIIREVLRGIPLKLIKNNISQFHNEVKLRKQQWYETIKSNPGWILNLDADECFENKFSEEIDQLLSQDMVDVYGFRLYDFWDETHYREDRYWQAHAYYRPFLLRYRPEFQYKWHHTPQHCGRFPYNITELPTAHSSLRLKHYGWSRQKDRVKKYLRYLMLDPDAIYGWKEQYQSILDDSPHLIEFKEE